MGDRIEVNQFGLQINLDNGEGRIIEGSIVDSIFEPCTTLDISFECQIRLMFTADNRNYIRYKSCDFIPISYSEVYTPNKTWHYEMSCVPLTVGMYLTKAYENTRQLATSMELELLDGSDALPLKCPLINLHAGEVIQQLRKFHFDDAYMKGDMKESYFIYCNSKKLMSVKWGKLIASEMRPLVDTPLMMGNNKIFNIDQRLKNHFHSEKLWKPWNQADYLKKLLGKFVEIETPIPVAFPAVYTIKFSDTQFFDKNVPYLCVRTEQDIMRPDGFTNTFAEISYLDGRSNNNG